MYGRRISRREIAGQSERMAAGHSEDGKLYALAAHRLPAKENIARVQNEILVTI